MEKLSLPSGFTILLLSSFLLSLFGTSFCVDLARLRELLEEGEVFASRGRGGGYGEKTWKEEEETGKDWTQILRRQVVQNHV
ncbi:hypothetical protein PoB_000874400 [Plakobranchus ocellatus]|uniref:Uncharacterized protein n=1 Tax=Plakobranchus ocellatus TaxID=259542 RepID=A0AAV3YJL8_9GAST|nr:hypothetical protein PoB_000874400 [Plakobranchus ocellatus]